MLTLTDINRALDRLGVAAFIPRTRRQPIVRVDGGSMPVDRDPERAVLGFPRPARSRPAAPTATLARRRHAGTICRRLHTRAVTGSRHRLRAARARTPTRLLRAGRRRASR